MRSKYRGTTSRSMSFLPGDFHDGVNWEKPNHGLDWNREIYSYWFSDYRGEGEGE